MPKPIRIILYVTDTHQGDGLYLYYLQCLLDNRGGEPTPMLMTHSTFLIIKKSLELSNTVPVNVINVDLTYQGLSRALTQFFNNEP